MPARYATIADLPSDFSGIPAGTAQEALDLMRPFVNPAVPGPCALVTSEMHAALAAHWLSLNPNTSGSGGGIMDPRSKEIDKIRIGPVPVRSFLLPFSLSRTKWGQLYLDLSRAHCIPSLMVV